MINLPSPVFNNKLRVITEISLDLTLNVIIIEFPL